MINNNTLDSYYVITAINTKSKEREYYATDSHSGGYPYWTSFLSSAERKKSVPVIKWSYNDCMFSEHPDIEILRIDVIVAESWTVEDAARAVFTEKKSKLEAEIKALQAEMDKLGK
jgi:hypothetical protein